MAFDPDPKPPEGEDTENQDQGSSGNDGETQSAPAGDSQPEGGDAQGSN